MLRIRCFHNTDHRSAAFVTRSVYSFRASCLYSFCATHLGRSMLKGNVTKFFSWGLPAAYPVLELSELDAEEIPLRSYDAH